MAKFFINRPIFAWVIAIIMMLAGAISIRQLPISQYPQIALPQVVIYASYPGASAETLTNTVTQVIEQNMNGLDHLLYMTSTSESSGRATITITFQSGANPDIAQVQVQNKLQLATPQLPQVVQRLGMTVKKTSASFLMVVGFISRDGSMNEADIADYVNSTLKDSVARIDGVGDVTVFGANRSMRIWVDPVKLSNYSLTFNDIEAVILNQNMQVSSGQLGGMPQSDGTQLNATIIAQSQLQTPEQFENILIRVKQDGAELRMRDVARVERGQDDYSTTSRYNSVPASGVAISLATGANALATADNVKAFMERAKQFFPPGLDTVYPYDTSPFVRLSIQEVVKTLIEAVILVVLVLFVFLQNWRTTIIPSIAVPVVLLGFGFTINTLTMLGMVLAIGLLVDDAIVVVENVERLMREEKLPPKEAAERSMEQLTGALIGTAMVLVAVFIPMAFFGGSTGVIYRQFSITISATMILSIVVAIVLTPALCATILKPYDHDAKPTWFGARLFAWFFGWFNRNFARCVRFYEWMVGRMVSRYIRYILIYLVLVAGMFYIIRRIPSSFLPDEDQGIILVLAQLPAGATMERTQAVMKQVEEYVLTQEKDAVEAMFSVSGYSFAGMGQNSGMAFVRLRDWDHRQRPELKAKAVAGRIMGAARNIRDGMVFPIIPPAVIDLGIASGFDFQIQDKAGVGHDKLVEAMNQFLGLAYSPRYSNLMRNVRHNGKDDEPEYKIEIDQSQAFSYGVNLVDIHDVLQNGWGPGYINDFLDKGRIKRVYMQAESRARMLPEDFDKWYVRNNEGKMVPFGSLITKSWVFGSPRLERFNGLPAVEIQGEPVPGVSTGQAMAACEEIMKQVNPGVGLEWYGLSYQERAAGAQTVALYSLSLLAIFLFLAALYESWTIPLSILFVVPIGIVGVEAAAMLFGLSNDVYFQVGFLTIIGLAAKNAILIVEFAKELHERHGMTVTGAALEACRLRLRPIMMTVLTFILGVMPLAVANGAGSGAQNAIGIGIVGGMVTNTLLGIFFVPLFYVLVTWLFIGRDKPAKSAGTDAPNKT